MTKFEKDKSGKPRYELIPPTTLKALAEVLTMGAEKYEANSWKTDDAEPHTAAAMRHFEAWRGGEAIDEESGLPHLIHAMTNIMFLYENRCQWDENGSKPVQLVQTSRDAMSSDLMGRGFDFVELDCLSYLDLEELWSDAVSRDHWK